MPSLLLFALPLLPGTLYLAYLYHDLARQVTCQTTPYLQDATIELPDAVQQDLKHYAVHHERVSSRMRIARSSISRVDSITIFLRHTMSAFATSLPGYGIYYSIASDAHNDRRTFDRAHLQALDFGVGDRVCGVYVVSARTDQRVVLSLDAPKSYRGPKAVGMIVVEANFRECGEEGHEEEDLEFVNHTVMWRNTKENGGSAGVLEGKIGRWVHGVLVRRLVDGGVKAVMEASKHGRME